MEESSIGNRKCASLTALLCGRTGLLVLVSGYALLGALLFKTLEGGDEGNLPFHIQRSREDCLRELWLITEEKEGNIWRDKIPKEYVSEIQYTNRKEQDRAKGGLIVGVRKEWETEKEMKKEQVKKMIKIREMDKTTEFIENSIKEKEKLIIGGDCNARIREQGELMQEQPLLLLLAEGDISDIEILNEDTSDEKKLGLLEGEDEVVKGDVFQIPGTNARNVEVEEISPTGNIDPGLDVQDSEPDDEDDLALVRLVKRRRQRVKKGKKEVDWKWKKQDLESVDSTCNIAFLKI
ncbi:hypothetical protein FQR65_LT03865 [Abscondita terminalis]|nr:hypothetical protein FQR65_LT03865 [Abscondita terminalis]